VQSDRVGAVLGAGAEHPGLRATGIVARVHGQDVALRSAPTSSDLLSELGITTSHHLRPLMPHRTLVRVSLRRASPSSSWIP
jgi:hypothetical protein